ncbi:MAG: CoA transferase [Solirubrobacteraceae bacterium]|nr:CoA transferase [Solirubrobacteraceae bacterium]
MVDRTPPSSPDLRQEGGGAGRGPLAGIRVVELAGLGPGPFCCMMLADMGAEVVRVDRVSQVGGGQAIDRALNRGRRTIAVDLKHPDGMETVLRLAERADVLVEGYRPGVAERLGVGPDAVRARNPRLVYGRMTGWGQDGPWASQPGHDINYIALTGALHAIGSADRPVPPLNLVGDFGGGGALLAFGIVSALLEATRSGEGQVVDAAMVDGAALVSTAIHGMRHEGAWEDEREANILDGGAPYYGTYRTADDRWVAVGSVEPQFFAALLEGLGIDPSEIGRQDDRATWPATRERFAEVFRTRTRDEWCERLEPLGACFAPVLSLDEAPDHPHVAARGTFVEVEGRRVPGPAPRLSRTPGEVGAPPADPGTHTDAVLRDWGVDGAEIARLRDAGAVA